MLSILYMHFLVLVCAALQALTSTIISILVALPCAYFFNRFTFWAKDFCIAAIPLLCIMPSKLTALGIQLSSGLNGFSGIIWGHCALNIPFALYVLYGAYQKINPHWQMIAQELGATRWQAYKDIDFPFLYPTIISTSIIIFLLCFTSFSLPTILGTHTWHMTPDILISEYYKNSEYAHAFIYFIVRLIVLLPICLSIKNEKNSWMGISEQKRYEKFRYVHHGMSWVILLVCMAIIVWGPLCSALYNMIELKTVLYLFSVCQGTIDQVLKIPVYYIICNSVQLAFVSAIGSLLLGYALLKIYRAFKSSRIKKGVSLLSSAIFILGSVGCGILFSCLSSCVFFSKFLIAIVCHILLNYPFAYRLIGAQLCAWQSEWDLSAQSFGAKVTDRWFTLEFPFLKTAFVQAFCITFGLSLTEVGAGSILSDQTGITIPMAIRLYREHGIMEGVMGLSFILLAMVFVLGYMLHKVSKHFA